MKRSVRPSELQAMGPVQILVVGFEGPQFRGEILPELRRLKDHDIVRLVDLLVVSKDDQGEVRSLQTSDLSTEEAEAFGALAGALIGYGAAGEAGLKRGAGIGAEAADERRAGLDEGDVWTVADAIPNGSAAAVALLEHRWAIPLRDAIGRAGGITLADTWIHPEDLVAVGMEMAEATAG